MDRKLESRSQMFGSREKNRCSQEQIKYQENNNCPTLWPLQSHCTAQVPENCRHPLWSVIEIKFNQGPGCQKRTKLSFIMQEKIHRTVQLLGSQGPCAAQAADSEATLLSTPSSPSPLHTAPTTMYTVLPSTCHVGNLVLPCCVCSIPIPFLAMLIVQAAHLQQAAQAWLSLHRHTPLLCLQNWKLSFCTAPPHPTAKVGEEEGQKSET